MQNAQSQILKAAESGDVAVLVAAIMAGNDINEPHANSWTPLMWACANGHEACVKLLIGNNADLNLVDSEGNTAIMLTTVFGTNYCFRLLADAGASLIARDRQFNTILNFAAYYNRSEFIHEILSREGINQYIPDNPDIPCALRTAAYRGNKESVQALLEHGYPTAITDSDNRTPLTQAALRGNDACLMLLINASSNIEASDTDGYTALMEAVNNKQHSCATILLASGANIHAKNIYKQLTMDIAVSNHDSESVRILLSAGSDPPSMFHARENINRMYSGDVYANAEKKALGAAQIFIIAAEHSGMSDLASIAFISGINTDSSRIALAMLETKILDQIKVRKNVPTYAAI